MNRRVCYWIWVVSLLTGAPLARDRDSVKKIPLRLPSSEQITVTANRYEEKTARVAANISVINEEDISSSTATDIPSLLRAQVNVQVSDIGGNRRLYSVDIRGFGETGPSNTLVLVDGRRVNQPSLSGVDWFQIPIDRVKRIEIIRGGRGSVLYGDNAGAGVINIITREEGPPRADVEISGGSYGSVRPSARVRGSAGDVVYSAAGSYFRSDGYRDNSEIKGGDFGGSLGFRLGDAGNLDLSGGIHSDKTGLPGAIRESQFLAGASRVDAPFPEDFVDIDEYYFLVRPEIRFLGQSDLQLNFSARRRDSKFFSSFTGGTFEGNTETDMFTASPRVVLREKIGGLANSLSVGYDFVDAVEDIINTTIFGGSGSASPFELKKRNHAFYVYDEVYPVESLALSAGYRHDGVTFRFAPSTPDRMSYDENLYTAGANYQFWTETFLYTNYSRSFRYPLLDEMFNFFANTIDTELTPQTANDVEVGLRHYFTDTFFGNLNLFHIDLDREIFFNPLGGSFGFGANENFEGITRRRGLEIALGTQVEGVTLKGSYSFVDADVKDGQYAGNQVPAVAAHKATVEAFIPVSYAFHVGVNGTYVGQRHFISDWSNVFGKQEGYFLLNARLSHQLERFHLFLDLNNLLNREYSEYGVLGGFPVERGFYPSPQVNARAGVRFSIR